MIFILLYLFLVEDIRVRFFQESIEWESFGTFGHQDVHKQVIIFADTSTVYGYLLGLAGICPRP